jgi:hypothetical protein
VVVPAVEKYFDKSLLTLVLGVALELDGSEIFRDEEIESKTDPSEPEVDSAAMLFISLERPASWLVSLNALVALEEIPLAIESIDPLIHIISCNIYIGRWRRKLASFRAWVFPVNKVVSRGDPF